MQAGGGEDHGYVGGEPAAGAGDQRGPPRHRERTYTAHAAHTGGLL